MKKLKAVIVLTLTIIGFSVAVTTAQTAKKETSKQEVQATSTIKVKCIKGGCCGGTMLCCGNKASVFQKSLEGVEGVSKVEVNKQTAEATVQYTGEVTQDDLNKAVRKDGFVVKKVESEVK